MTAQLLSLFEAADEFGVDSAEVIRMIYRDEVTGIVQDGRLMVPATQVTLRDESRVRQARRAYVGAVADLVEHYGATVTAKALGVPRPDVDQLLNEQTRSPSRTSTPPSKGPR